MKDLKVNPDLAEERKSCPFDQEELTILLDGGKQSTDERRRLEKYFLQSGVREICNNELVSSCLITSHIRLVMQMLTLTPWVQWNDTSMILKRAQSSSS